MNIINCDQDYSTSILDILNEAIINSTALYDYQPRTLESMATWFEIKMKNNFPVIGLVNDQNELVGFGSYGTFRGWSAYKYSVEHSLYIHKVHRGNGYGKIILKEIIKDAIQRDYHTLIGGIDSANVSSKRLHESVGFQFAGQIKHAGYKFSRWLDLDFYQLILSTPSHPTEK